MTEFSDLPEVVREAVHTEIKSLNRLHQLGFAEDDYGQWKASNCKVTVYPCLGDYEIDITLPNGSVVGFDVKPRDFHGTTAEEITQLRPPTS